MTMPPPPDVHFDELPPEEQERIRTCGDQMVRLAQQHAGGLIIGPPPGRGGGEINTASYCVLEKDGTPYLVTAEHVLAKSEMRMAENPAVVWQAGELIFDPRGRIAARDATKDVVLIKLGKVEAAMTSVSACSALAGWPPPPPKRGDYVLVSGYPAIIIQHHPPRTVEFRAISAMFEVTASGDFHSVCQWDRENMVRFGGPGPGVPAHGIDLGGMSGGPVFLVRQLTYPLVGIVPDFHSDWELMRLGMLSAVAFP